MHRGTVRRSVARPPQAPGRDGDRNWQTRTAAAFIKWLFEAGVVTRLLFLVDRIALARQAEGSFTDHLRDYPCHVVQPDRGFDRAKCITAATFHTMTAEYRTLSPGYESLAMTLHAVSIPPLRSPINYFGNLPASSLERHNFLIKRPIAA